MKLMLACAFSYDAKLLILDEPTSGLDPVSRERFYVYLSEDCWRKLPVFKPENLEHDHSAKMIPPVSLK